MRRGGCVQTVTSVFSTGGMAGLSTPQATRFSSLQVLLFLYLAASAANAASVRGFWSLIRDRQPGNGLFSSVHVTGDCTPQQERDTHLMPLQHLCIMGAGAGSFLFNLNVLLSLGSDATQMHLSWKTAGANCPSEVVYQRLEDDLTTAQLLQQQRLENHQQSQQQFLVMGMANTDNAIGFTYLLSERDMCDDPAASNPFLWQLHRATLKNLVPSATYRYRVEGGEHHWYFNAAPAPSPDASFTFLGFGDMGDAVHPAAKSPGAASTLLRLQREAEKSHSPAELMLHVGDLSYANGNPEIWDSFLEGLQPFAARIPYMVAVGNHEYGYSARKGSSATLTDPSGAAEPYQPSWGNFGPDSQGECGAFTARRFHMPNYKGRRDNAPFWYGFDYGSVHFTTISTEHSLVPGSRQYEWLEAELAAVDRCVTPWLVVALHRPMYVVYPHKSNREVGEHIRAQIEPLLLRYKVDLTIAGHVHSYYRTCAVRDEQCTDDYGDLRVVPTAAAHKAASGAAGAAAAASGTTSAVQNAGSTSTKAATGATAAALAAAAGVEDSLQRQRHGIVHLVIGSAGRKLSDVEDDQADWCAQTFQKWGYGRFTVRGSRSLLVEYVASEDGEVLDSVELRPTDAARGAVCSPVGGVARS